MQQKCGTASKTTEGKIVEKKEALKIQKKPREIYKQEVQEVLIKLPEKYFKFLKLFVKKEYWLLQHKKEYKVQILLKKEYKLPQIKQQQIS